MRFYYFHQISSYLHLIRSIHELASQIDLDPSILHIEALIIIVHYLFDPRVSIAPIPIAHNDKLNHPFIMIQASISIEYSPR